MKTIKLISGIIIGFFSTTTIIEMFNEERGASLYGAITGYIILMIFSVWLVFSGSRESKSSNLKVNKNEKDSLVEQSKDKLLTHSKENLKKLRDSNLLTQEEYDSKLSQITNKDFEEKIKKNNEYGLLKNLYDSGVLNKNEFEEKTKILIEKQSINKVSDYNVDLKPSSQSLNNPTKESQFKKSTPPEKDNSRSIAVVLAILFFGGIVIIGINGGFKKSEPEEDFSNIPVAAVVSSVHKRYVQLLRSDFLSYFLFDF